MSDRDRKLVWIVGVVTLLAGGFFIGRLFGGDGNAASPLSGNEIAGRPGGSASNQTTHRIPIESEHGDDDRPVTTPSDVGDVDARQDRPKIVRTGNGRSGSRGTGNASGDPVPDEEEKTRVPSMGAVEL